MFGDKKIGVKVKIVSCEKKGLLRHELSALKVLTGSKYFVNLLNDYLLSSTQFTVSPSDGPSDLLFDNHVAMVMEKGIITLDDHLSRHSNELSQGDFLQIITCVFNMVKDAHANNVVILDIKGANIMLFESAKGLYIWKGIDLDGSLPIGSQLDVHTFMATVPFMAPELLLRDKTPGLKAQSSMDVWSLGILIFNVLICKKFQTFWTLLGIHSDADIKAEILSGKFTQLKVDKHIDRYFPEHSNSAARHFLQQLLRLDPSERAALPSLQNAALLTGVASISTSDLFNNQIQLLRDLKPLNDLFTTELALFRTSLQSLLVDDKSLDLGYLSDCLASLRCLLEEQALSTIDCKSIIQNLSNWQIPAGPSADPPIFSHLMNTATLSLQNLLSAADEKKISTAQRKELLLQLASEVYGVQEQVQEVREHIAVLHRTFVDFGAIVRKELAENSQKHSLLIEKLHFLEATTAAIIQEQATSKANAQKTIQTCEQMKLQMVAMEMDTSAVDHKIASNITLLNTIEQNELDAPKLMVLAPMLQDGSGDVSPINMHRDEARLFFICEKTKELVPCGRNGDGYTIKLSEPLIKKAMPVLKVGFLLLQVGLLATGIPIPLARLVNSSLAQSDKMSYLHSAWGLLHENGNHDNKFSTEELSGAVRELEGGDDRESIHSAYDAIKAFLKEVDPNLMHIGLSKEVSASGRVGWVKRDASVIQHFKESGEL